MDVERETIELPIDSPWLAWLAAMPEKCSACGTVKSGIDLNLMIKEDRFFCSPCLEERNRKIEQRNRKRKR
jgi:hypothetical protein